MEPARGQANLALAMISFMEGHTWMGEQERAKGEYAKRAHTHALCLRGMSCHFLIPEICTQHLALVDQSTCMCK